MQRVVNQSVIQPSVVNVKCFDSMSSLTSFISVSSHAECYSTKCYLVVLSVIMMSIFLLHVINQGVLLPGVVIFLVIQSIIKPK
jgi:hypothetical protein